MLDVMTIDNPPKGSFFKSQARKGASTPPASPANTASAKATLTPGKMANLRSTYIQQIKELHSLWEIGAITKEHYLKQDIYSTNGNTKVLQTQLRYIELRDVIVHACSYMTLY